MLQDNHSKSIIIIGTKIPVLQCYQTRVFDFIKITGYPGIVNPGLYALCMELLKYSRFNNDFIFTKLLWWYFNYKSISLFSIYFCLLKSCIIVKINTIVLKCFYVFVDNLTINLSTNIPLWFFSHNLFCLYLLCSK